MISGTVIAFNNTIVPLPGIPGYGEGGGIFVDARKPTDKLVLDDVYVINNQASSFSAGGIQNSGTLVLTDVTLKDNTGANCSGGTGCP
jgi:hypothetical protein